MDIHEFTQPGSTYRSMPFWSWNGRLEAAELKRQIDVFSKMGMGGYFCHSRTGLITPYLGDEWFELIRQCADYGSARGMETWLYDEDRWPSGTAGGMVTEHPDFRLKFIRMTCMTSEEYCRRAQAEGSEKAIAAFTVDLHERIFCNKRQIQDPEALAGEPAGTVLCFTIEEMQRESVYNGYTYVDTLNQNATADFIARTHEAYRKNTGSRMGQSIKGIFMDEPHRGAVMNGFGIQNPDAEYLTPYTQDLFEEFEKRFGYDLRNCLPELFLFEGRYGFSHVKYHYMELLQELFLERFIQPIAQWCRESGLQLTGHMLQEDSLTAQACMVGSIMRVYEHMDIPGVDVLTESNDCHWLMKQIQSVARQTGKTRILTELYGCTGWHLTFQEHKAIGTWQALFGANLRCHHLAWYSMQGEAKRDYPASISFQSDWHRYYAYVEDYFARLHWFMAQGRPVCRVLVLNPIESLWGIIHPGWAHMLEPVNADAVRIDQAYAEVFRAFCNARVDFDYGDEEQLARLGWVSEDGRLYVGESSYTVVVGFEMKTIRSSTLRLLRRMQAAGGHILFGGAPPVYVDAQPSAEAEELLGGCALPFEPDALTKAVLRYTQEETGPQLKILCADTGRPARDIYQQIRFDGSRYFIMLLNMDRENSRTVHIFGLDQYRAEMWDPRTGYIYHFCADGTPSVPYTFCRDGELLLVLSPVNRAYVPDYAVRPLPTAIEQGTRHLIMDFSFPYRLTEPNVCVLDRAVCRVGALELPELDILEIDDKLREQYGLPLRGGDMMQPWYQPAQPREFDPIALTFTFQLDGDFGGEWKPDSIVLAVETPDEFSIEINGYAMEKRILHRQWVDPCFKLMEIPLQYLKTGVNSIRLSTVFSTASNIEAVYLLGDFAVNIQGLSMVLHSLPEALRAGSLCEQGLPFYGAGVVYNLPASPVCRSGERLYLDLGDSRAACCVVRPLGGEEERIVGFHPFIVDITDWAGLPLEVEYSMTRRNTFGPLHKSPENSRICIPDSFKNRNPLFLSDRFGLIPQGMLCPLSFYIVSSASEERIEVPISAAKYVG